MCLPSTLYCLGTLCTYDASGQDACRKKKKCIINPCKSKTFDGKQCKQNHISNQMYLNTVSILQAHFLFGTPDILLFAQDAWQFTSLRKNHSMYYFPCKSSMRKKLIYALHFHFTYNLPTFDWSFIGSVLISLDYNRKERMKVYSVFFNYIVDFIFVHFRLYFIYGWIYIYRSDDLGSQFFDHFLEKFNKYFNSLIQISDIIWEYKNIWIEYCTLMWVLRCSKYSKYFFKLTSITHLQCQPLRTTPTSNSQRAHIQNDHWN